MYYNDNVRIRRRKFTFNRTLSSAINTLNSYFDKIKDKWFWHLIPLHATNHISS